MGKGAPGPGAYNSTNYGKKSSPRFSIRYRAATTLINSYGKNNPGPGQYPLPDVINPKGEHLYDKFRNSASTLFSPPSSVRFKPLSKHDKK